MGESQVGIVDAGMDVRHRVGLNVQRLRRARDLSQEELAHRSGIHQTYLSGVETGRRNPSIQVLQRIAEALDGDIEDLTRRTCVQRAETA